MKVATPRSRRFRRGEVIQEAGTRPDSFFVIQSGAVSVSQVKEGNAPLFHASAPCPLSEEAVFGAAQVVHRALAINETQAIEIPLELAKTQLETSHPVFRVLLKGLAERLKLAGQDLKNLRIAQNATMPCPADGTAKLFGVIFHTARITGSRGNETSAMNETFSVAWPEFRDHAIEVFQENAVRLEQGIHILAKLGYARIESTASSAHSPSVDTWRNLRFQNLAQVEDFFEFYQNYHFRGGYSAFLKTNDRITEITQALVQAAADSKTDRNGLVSLPYRQTIDRMKELFGKSFEGDQLYRLEQKGLQVKRISSDQGGSVTFLKPEFETMLRNWRILREVELWNQRGWVIRDEEIASEPTKLAGDAGVTSEISAPLKETPPPWQPLFLAGSEIILRTEPPRAGELLCQTCLSPVSVGQRQCQTCDSDL